MIDHTILGAFLWYVVGGAVLFVITGLMGLAIFVFVLFISKEMLRFKDVVQPPDNNER